MKRTLLAVALCILVFMSAAQAQATRAALTRDVDRPTAQPVNGICQPVANAQGYTRCVLYKVPPGKVLVVETVSYLLTTGVGGIFLSLLFGSDDGAERPLFDRANTYAVLPTFAFDTIGQRTFTGSQALKAYFDENQSFSAMAISGTSNGLQQTFSFSGYLVDK